MDTLNIFLGNKCNFKCSYCLQNSDLVYSDIDYRVFIKNLLPIIKERKLNEVAYWGGEPLLYWEEIRTIQNAFLSNGIYFDSIRFTTNGSLLNEESVRILNNWKAHVVISDHKGFGSPNWDMVSNLHKSSISFLFSNKDITLTPWIKQIDELEEKYQKPFFPYLTWVKATPNCDSSFYFTEDSLHEHHKHLITLLEQPEICRKWFRGPIKEWKEALNNRELGPMCTGIDQYSVDCLGNTYSCHHSITEEFRNKNNGDIFYNSVECTECDIRNWCRGNCFISNTHELDCKHKLFLNKLFSQMEKYVV